MSTDLNATAVVASKQDVKIASDTNLSGAGDIIFSTHGTERARITTAGVPSGFTFGGWDAVYQVAADRAFATTSLADVSDLIAPVVVSALYEFSCVLYLSSPDTAGLELGVNGPTGAVVNANLWGGTTTTAATGCNIQALNTKAGTAFAALNGLAVVTIQGFMLTDASHAGSLSIQADKKTSGTGTVLKGSVMRFRRVY